MTYGLKAFLTVVGSSIKQNVHINSRPYIMQIYTQPTLGSRGMEQAVCHVTARCKQTYSTQQSAAETVYTERWEQNI